MDEIESEDQGGGSGSPFSREFGAIGVRLAGPIENLLSLENIHPDHDYDDKDSNELYDMYNSYLRNLRSDIFLNIENYATNSFIYTSIREIFYSRIENKVTFLLNIEFSLKLMNVIVKDFCAACSVNTRDLVAFYSWPSERPRPHKLKPITSKDSTHNATQFAVYNDIVYTKDEILPQRFDDFFNSLYVVDSRRRSTVRISGIRQTKRINHLKHIAERIKTIKDSKSFLEASIVNLTPITKLDYEDAIFTCSAHWQDGDSKIQIAGNLYTLESHSDYYDSLQALLELADCSIYCLNMNEEGSFFKDLKAILNNRMSDENVEKKLELLDDMLTSVALLKGEIPIEEHIAKIAGNFLPKVSKKKRAIMLIGSILILKFEIDDETSTIITRRLSKDQADLLYQSPRSLRDPEVALDVLAGSILPIAAQIPTSPHPRVIVDPFGQCIPGVPTFISTTTRAVQGSLMQPHTKEDDERG